MLFKSISVKIELFKLFLLICHLFLPRKFNNNALLSLYLGRLLKIVAIVETARSMLFPISHANPTKFKVTVSACHVHTTLILLNVNFALRTRLGIFLNPTSV